MSRRLSILLTNIVLNGRTGTEIVTRDIALGLLQAGHRPIVYTRAIGAIGADLAARGVAVETRIDSLPDEFDVIHGNHLMACTPVLARYPNVPAVAFCHDALTWYDSPPHLPSIARYAAISRVLTERVAQERGIAPSNVALVLNGVDTNRFQPGPPPQHPPRRALAFAKNREHIESVRVACERRGIAVDFIGAAGAQIVKAPEQLIPAYDLVFASALSAIEAMACLRPTIVCDGRGLAGMVDQARYVAWRPHNFGAAVLQRALSVENFEAELDRYDPTESALVGERVRRDANIPAWIASLEGVYADAMRSFTPVSATVQQRAWARHLEVWGPQHANGWQWLNERQHLLNANWRAASQLEPMPRQRAIGFGLGAGSERFVELLGFGDRDESSAWTTQRFAGFRMDVSSVGDVEVRLDYAVFLPDADYALKIEVLANGLPADAWEEAGAEGWRADSRVLTLPAAEARVLSTWLMFKLSQAGGGASATAPSFSLRTIEVKAV